MSGLSAVASTQASVKGAFPSNKAKLRIVESAEPAWFRALYAPQLSDKEHLKRAFKSGKPHTYISKRAGMLKFGKYRGLGEFNAEQLHFEVFRRQKNDGAKKDVAAMENSRNSSRSYNLALAKFHGVGSLDY